MDTPSMSDEQVRFIAYTGDEHAWRESILQALQRARDMGLEEAAGLAELLGAIDGEAGIVEVQATGDGV